MPDLFPYESKFYEQFHDYTHVNGVQFLRLEMTLDRNEMDIIGRLEWLRNKPIVEFGGRTLYLYMLVAEGSKLVFTMEYANY